MTRFLLLLTGAQSLTDSPVLIFLLIVLIINEYFASVTHRPVLMTTHTSSYPCIYIYQGPIPPTSSMGDISISPKKMLPCKLCLAPLATLRMTWGWGVVVGGGEGEIKHPSSNLGITLLLHLCLFFTFN